MNNLTLDESVHLYSMVLRQLLPTGGYDNAPDTTIDLDIKSHAKALAQADLDAKRLLNVINNIPTELIAEYEAEYGLPLACSVNVTRSIAERIEIIKWIRSKSYGLTYYQQLFTFFGVELVSLVKPKPLQCTAPSTSAANTEQLRYKVKLVLSSLDTTDIQCIINNYFPAFLQVDVVEV